MDRTQQREAPIQRLASVRGRHPRYGSTGCTLRTVPRLLAALRFGIPLIGHVTDKTRPRRNEEEVATRLLNIKNTRRQAAYVTMSCLSTTSDSLACCNLQATAKAVGSYWALSQLEVPAVVELFTGGLVQRIPIGVGGAEGYKV